MRQTIALAAGLIALFGLTSLATAQAPEQDWHGSLSFYFGDCEPLESPSSVQTSANLIGDGCNGLGLFWGDWDKQSLVNGISEEASDRFGGFWRVTELKAYDLISRETITGEAEYDQYPCGFVPTPPSEEFGHIAFWVAWFSLEPCDSSEGPPAWTVNAVLSIGCGTSGTQLSTRVTGIDVFPTTLRFRTIVDSGGLRYMDEDAGTPGDNGDYGWSIYNSSTGGPTTATFPLLPDTEYVIQLWLIDGPAGPFVTGTQVTIDKCNGGSVTSIAPLSPPP